MKSSSIRKSKPTRRPSKACAPLTKSKRNSSTSKSSIKLVILGAPGGGKGTISKKLVKDFEFHHISTGDLLRKEISNNTPLGSQANTFIKAGQLVPDQLVIDMVKSEVAAAGERPILLDGFPRTLPQAEALKSQLNITRALNLQVPDSEIVERTAARWTHLPSGRVYSYVFEPPKVKGLDDVTGEPLVQREDDKPEAVTQRLKTYHEKTFPLLTFYQQDNILTQYDGSNQPELLAKGRRSDAIYVDLKQDVQALFGV